MTIRLVLLRYVTICLAFGCLLGLPASAALGTNSLDVSIGPFPPPDPLDPGVFIGPFPPPDPLDHAEVFVAERQSNDVQRFNIGGRTAYSVAWRDAESLAVVVADPSYPSLPVHKDVRTLRLSDGSLE